MQFHKFLFQVRLNFRANMLPIGQIFAQALGFRMNWDDPPDSFRPYHHLTRRAVYKNIEILLNKYVSLYLFIKTKNRVIF